MMNIIKNREDLKKYQKDKDGYYLLPVGVRIKIGDNVKMGNIYIREGEFRTIDLGTNGAECSFGSLMIDSQCSPNIMTITRFIKYRIKEIMKKMIEYIDGTHDPRW